MQHARQRKDAQPPHPDWAALAEAAEARGRRAGEYLDRAGRLLDAAEAGGPLPDWLDRNGLSLLYHGLRQLGAAQTMDAQELGRISLEHLLNDMTLAAAEGAGFRQGAAAGGGRHRAPRSRKPIPGQLKLVPGGAWKAPAVSAAAGLAAFRHAAAVKAASLPVAATAATATAATIVLGGVAVTPYVAQSRAAHHQAAPQPVLGPDSAIPITVPPPDYEPRHAKASPAAASATAVPPPPVVTLAPAPKQPSPRPSAAPSGTLDVQTVQVAIGPSGDGTIAFTAVGGRVAWRAWSSSPDLSLDASAGLLGDGQPGVITLRVAPGSVAGTGTVTIWAGGQQEDVQVIWTAVPGLGL